MTALPDPDFIPLLRLHALGGLDRQLHLADVIGDADWLLDQGEGTVTFGNEIVSQVQVLGSESTADQTWLWAWANATIRSSLADSARSLRDFGELNRIDVFREPSFPMAGLLTGETIALIATGIVDTDGYYRAPYDGGSLFLLLDLPAAVRSTALSAVQRTLRTLTRAVDALGMHVGEGEVADYMRELGLSVHRQARRLTAQDSTGTVVVSFDSDGSISKVGASLG